MALVGIFLTTTGSAEELYRPSFSWDTVALYAHFGATDGMSDADVEFVATHYDFIALEKNHGASQYGTTEEGTIADVARIKAINPDAKRITKMHLSNPDFRSWWATTAVDMLVRGSMDGVFVDAIPQISARRTPSTT